MKNSLIAFIILVLSPIVVSAQSADAVWESEYDRWDVSFHLAGGLSYGWSLTANPSIELIVSSIRIDDFLPLDFGIAVRGMIANYDRPNAQVAAGWRHIGIGISATAHLSFNNLKNHSLPFMENFDFFVTVGPLYDIITFSGAYASSSIPIPATGIGFTTTGGVNYFLLDWLAVGIEIYNWSFTGGLSAGLILNF